jgi:phosphonoacetaldehyde hydrolase
MFASFQPLQLECLGQYSGVIPGVLEATDQMRARGLRIGSTTGYTRLMLDAILPSATAQGFCPDSTVTPDEAGGGRPAPWMCYLNLVRLGVFPTEACVKIGDTPSDIEEGLNAGMWTIGILDSSNEIGLTEAQWSQLAEVEKQKLRNHASHRLLAAGAHYVVNSLAQVPAILDRIEQKLECTS